MNGELPVFSPIPWAVSINSSERYPSPPAEASSRSTAAVYPISNGVNRMSDETVSGEGYSSISANASIPPPIDAVDIGIVPEHVARAAQETGPPPRSPEPVSVNGSFEPKGNRAVNGDVDMD
jgi:hypothetical protein